MADRPVTLTIAEFCARTGVGRERLRTWERRHGFPEPVRREGGPRRYAVDDVERVISVQSAVRSGVPLATAIAVARQSGGGGRFDASAEDFLAEVDHAPVPVIAVSGLDPVLIAWRNGLVRASPSAPREGEPLLTGGAAFADASGDRVLRDLLSGSLEGPVVVEHPDWCSELPRRASSLAWRIAGRTGAPPVAVLVGLPDDVRRNGANGRQREEWERLQAFGGAATAVAAALRDEIGPLATTRALSALAARVGAIDAALAPYAAGSLLANRSTRGLMSPQVVAVCAFDDLAAALHDGVVDWLGAPARDAFGVAGGRSLLIVPVIAAGERLGVILLVFSEELPLGDTERELLLCSGTSIGFALLRQRAADQLAEPGPAN